MNATYGVSRFFKEDKAGGVRGPENTIFPDPVFFGWRTVNLSIIEVNMIVSNRDLVGSVRRFSVGLGERSVRF